MALKPRETALLKIKAGLMLFFVMFSGVAWIVVAKLTSCGKAFWSC